MSQLGKKRVSVARRFTEGIFVGLGIAAGMMLFQAAIFGGLLAARTFMGF